MLDKIETMLRNHQVKPLGNQRQFAVMLPLIYHENEWQILYEVRSKKISQPGETSFPGGQVEPGETYEEAAVRETMEELNLRRDQLEVMGEINFISSEHVIIHCFVGRINAEVDHIHFNEEVADLFTIPLRYLKENRPTYYTSEFHLKHPEDFPYEMVPNGKNYRFRVGSHRIPFYKLENHSLWGFTANLTDHFIDLLVQNNIDITNNK